MYEVDAECLVGRPPPPPAPPPCKEPLAHISLTVVTCGRLAAKMSAHILDKPMLYFAQSNKNLFCASRTECTSFLSHRSTQCALARIYK